MTRSTMHTFVLITMAAILTVFGGTGRVFGDAATLLGEPGSPIFSKTFMPSTIGPSPSD